EALALVFFLPRVWQRASQGQIDVWRARALAAECHGLSREALDYIDAEMSRRTARHTKGGRDAVIAQAKLEHMPQAVCEEETEGRKRRQVIFDVTNSASGTVDVFATLDVLDAKALMAAIDAHATYLGEQSDASRGVREAWALGDFARNALAQTPGEGPGTGVNLDFYLHLTPGSLAGDSSAGIRILGSGFGSGMILSPRVVQRWFARPWVGKPPKVTFRPVIDLEDHEQVDGYQVPARI